MAGPDSEIRIVSIIYRNTMGDPKGLPIVLLYYMYRTTVSNQVLFLWVYLLKFFCERDG